MAEYYLISQLPSLDGIGESTPLPITEEKFLELCDRLLSKKSQREMEKLTLVPSLELDESANDLIKAWCEGERALRLALAKVRADKMNKAFDLGGKRVSAELLKVASAAIEIQSPLEAEYFLLKYRLGFLETLRPMDNFSEDFVFYYGLRLKLLYRVRQFDASVGEVEYRKIYHSILNGDKLEAK